MTAPPLLEVEGLEKHFGGGTTLFGAAKPVVRAVDDLSFTLHRGETLGIVGETGSGKSTLARLVLQLIRPSAGRIRFEGQDVTGHSAAEVRALRRRMQMVFQDPYGSLDPRMTAGSIIAEPLAVHGTPRAEIAGRVAEVMHQVGLSPAMADRYPHEFSGGQRQRIGIARAVALAPALLVLDEPVSALDVSVQAQILNLLRDLQSRLGLAYLFIAHDLAVVRHVSDRVAVMYLGRIVETAPRDALYGAPGHPYTVSLLSAVPLADPVRERQRKRILLHGEIGSATALPSGCRFHPRCFRARLVAAATADTMPAAGAMLPRSCVEQPPELMPVDQAGHFIACHYPEEATA
jgi:oligopeptide transport system ATP-binding protein